MGASSSHLGPRPSRPRPVHHRCGPPKRSFFSLFICGGSFCSSPEIDDDRAELLVNSAQDGNRRMPRTPKKDSATSSGTGSGLTRLKLDTGVSSSKTVVANGNGQLRDGSGGVGTSHRGKYLSESKESVPPHLLISNYRSGENATSNNMAQPSMHKDICSGVTYHRHPSPNLIEESPSNESLIGSHVTEGAVSSNNDSSTTSVISDSPSGNHLPGDDSVYEAGPSRSGLLLSERELNRRDGNAHHVDLVNVLASDVSNSSSEVNSEATRDSRRVFWDTSSTQPQSDDLLDEVVGGDLRPYGSRARRNYEQQWHSRSEMLERLRGGLDGNVRETVLCPMGIHAEGTCSCGSMLRAESGFHASISRIVMLAEALFEVLDDIHRQPSSVSLPVVSLPAPESVVNTFPVKNYTKTVKSESSDDVAKCYICLSEYEEDDKIRVLPCQHEYHISCIDKWLKEIHGICPLCRRDVREGFTEGSTSSVGIPSL